MTRDLLQEAFGAMQYNRRRTALTMLGMAWGIATVVILLAFGSGFERAIGIIFSSWGTDVIGAFPGRTSLQAGGAKAGSEIRLQIADVDYIRNEVPMIKGVTPIFDKRNATIQHDMRTFTNLFLTGVYPVYERIRGFSVATGRGLSEEDQLQRGTHQSDQVESDEPFHIVVTSLPGRERWPAGYRPLPASARPFATWCRPQIGRRWRATTADRP